MAGILKRKERAPMDTGQGKEQEDGDQGFEDLSKLIPDAQKALDKGRSAIESLRHKWNQNGNCGCGF